MAPIRSILLSTVLLAFTISATPTHQAQYDAATNIVARQPAQLGQAIPDAGATNLISHAPTQFNLPRDALPAKREGDDISDGNKITLGVLATSIGATLEGWEKLRKLPWNIGTPTLEEEEAVALGVSLVHGLIYGLQQLDRHSK